MWRSPQRVVHDFTDSSPSGGMRLLQRLIGHGQRWRWGVDGAAGMQEVTVDADAAWASYLWSSRAAVLGGSRSLPQRAAVLVRVSVPTAIWRGGGGAKFPLFFGVRPRVGILYLRVGCSRSTLVVHVVSWLYESFTLTLLLT
jgi:hypothetical protein